MRYGDKDSVTMQTLQQKLAKGREIYLIHNHPNNNGASPADLSAATWLDAEYMLIVNPDGKVHRHQKIDGEIIELEPLNFPEFVAPVDLVETLVHSIAYGIQTAREIGNPAEAVFAQGEAVEDGITIETDSRLVRDFLLNRRPSFFWMMSPMNTESKIRLFSVRWLLQSFIESCRILTAMVCQPQTILNTNAVGINSKSSWTCLGTLGFRLRNWKTVRR